MKNNPPACKGWLAFFLLNFGLVIAVSSALPLFAQPPVKYDFFYRPSKGQIPINSLKPLQFEPIKPMMQTVLPGNHVLPGFNNSYVEEQNQRLLQEHGLLPGVATNLPPAAQMAQLERELIQEQFYSNHIQWLEKTASYRQAFNDLMQLNPDSFSLSRAEFIVENAWYNNRFEYKEFLQVINFYAGIVKDILKKEGLSHTSTITLNYGIQKLFQQSNTIVDQATGKTITLKPFRYDFDNWRGDTDYSQLFITKLLHTGKGQCNSMPRWYLILAEQLGAKAWLSLAPQHSFIQFPDKESNLVNFETTNGTVVSTNWLLQSGYINANALKAKTYLDTLSRRQLFGQCLADLLLGYIQKFGYDDFAEQIKQTILQTSPYNSSALIVDANLKTEQALHKIMLAGKPPVKDLANYPEAYQAYLAMMAAYEKVDATGYQDMPPEAYQQWLKSIEQEKKKQQTQELQENLKREIQKLKKVKVTITNKPKG